MIISISKYLSKDSRIGYIDFSYTGSLPSGLFIKFFYSDSKGEKTISKDLSNVSGSIYSFNYPTVKKKKNDKSKKDSDKESLLSIKDYFEVWSSNGLEFSIGNNDGDDDNSFSGKSVKIPQSEWEQQQIANTIIRVWGHDYPNTPFARKVSFANSSAQGINAFNFTFTVSDSNLFENCFNPADADREGINDLLSSASELFKGNSGKAYYVSKEGKIVIPLSNNSITWTEEFPVSSFLTAVIKTIASVTYRNNYFKPTRYYELTEVKEVNFNIGNSYRTYNNNSTYVPSTSLINAISNLESSYDIRTMNVPRYNFGDSIGFGAKSNFINQDNPAGITYGQDNYINWGDSN